MAIAARRSVIGTQRPLSKRVAIAAATGLVAWGAFQGILALGAPLGAAAWGGQHEHLSTPLRIASGLAVPLYVLAALIVLSRAGFRPIALPKNLVRRGLWIVVGVLLLSAFANAASASNWERFMNAPFALLLAVLCLLVARSAGRENSR